MLQATPPGTGGMLAIIGLKKEEIIELCKEAGYFGVIEIANYNSPTQIVVSGEMKPLNRLNSLAQRRGAKRVIPLKVCAPFHSSLMELAKDNLARYLRKVTLSDPKIPIISNVKAEYFKDREEIRSLLIEQMTHPVRWVEIIKKMNEEGINVYLEVGPGKVLSGLIKQIIPGAKVFNIFDSISLEEVRRKILEE